MDLETGPKRHPDKNVDTSAKNMTNMIQIT